MSKPKFYRRWRFAGVEIYSLRAFFVWVGLGGFEIQFNKWANNDD